jgi:hypothetical protein
VTDDTAAFDEWVVMNYKDVLFFDALVESMSGTHKSRKPFIAINTTDREKNG